MADVTAEAKLRLHDTVMDLIADLLVEIVHEEENADAGELPGRDVVG